MTSSRTWLAAQAVLLLLATLVTLGIAVGVGAYAWVHGWAVVLIPVALLLPAPWFLSRAMGERVNRLMRGGVVATFDEKNLCIAGARQQDDQQIAYRFIKKYSVSAAGTVVRVFLSGPWVDHPSGWQVISAHVAGDTQHAEELAASIAHLLDARGVRAAKHDKK